MIVGFSMKSLLTGLGLLFVSTTATATPYTTDFGVRFVPGMTIPRTAAWSSALPGATTRAHPAASLSLAVTVASQLGRVTSTVRSTVRNRAVGGAWNSYHLRGQAIDIVPRPGVRHADVEAALRRAGFQLVESLDEGDHSHFAFGLDSAAPVSLHARSTPQAAAR